ncbi:MAG: hypothetical protein A3F74_17400 [Betaproteobacteria bacterium RIFCSPLOWO2_12_FULL_62_58]|nr:MAG: hypothetical protein A3F74_17400 [Betaproteobacteria bacterium RIFCSPLOWO2_12_FULL_62_58]
MNAFLADLILVIHFLFVLFVVGGLILIWIGAAAGWGWVRNLWFRVAHFAAIFYVVIESVIGVVCPLTIWEDALRGAREEKSFIARWVHRMLFYDFPEWVFTIAYVAFALLVIATFWFVRPGSPRRRRGAT